jgi:uncharacterized membrane protein
MFGYLEMFEYESEKTLKFFRIGKKNSQMT